MNPTPSILSLYQPATYRVRVAGRLPEHWLQQSDEMEVSVERLENGAVLTVLIAPVADQAGLHGLLTQFRDLGLPLVSLELMTVA